ncbi:hypothetical protein SAMN05443582_101500 [Phyllobacterium sp. OV277]|nr:hypothetical protein SAMN05443582_101500 [Phyllobacterium sp. OV277]
MSGAWFVVRGSWFVVRGSWFVVRGSWFDKLTMRERGAVTLIANVAELDSLASTQAPHGEPVEPRTTNHVAAPSNLPTRFAEPYRVVRQAHHEGEG